MSGDQQLEHLAKLIQTRNAIDNEMAAVIGRPAQIGHLGEYIASRIFDIALDESASRKSIDGHFMSGPLAGRSVNIKWYGKLESMLDITPMSLPDYYLVLTGPRSTVLTSRGGVRPLIIEHVFLFDAAALARELAGSGVKVGIATSMRRHLWDAAEIYPNQQNQDLILTDEQRSMLAFFSSKWGDSTTTSRPPQPDVRIQAPLSILEKVVLLVEHIRNHPTFTITERMAGYEHMGALITDATLQAGIRYETVVLPRVQRILESYPEEASTTSGFLEVLQNVGPHALLNWKGEKPDRVLKTAYFFQREGVETASDLRQWLQVPEHITRLKNVRGIGDKTADYYRLLVGLPAVAVDRHLYGFLEEAGIPVTDYAEAHQVIREAAERLDVELGALDHSIWQYMSTRTQER